MKYGYARVSTTDQDLTIQVETPTMWILRESKNTVDMFIIGICLIS